MKDHELINKRMIQNYIKLSKSIINLLGDCCEIVIHSVEQLDSSVIYILNGHHTGRKVGSPITDKGLQILKNYKNNPEITEQSYFSSLPNGNVIKSITHIIIGQNNIPIGLFCINLNLSFPFEKIVSGFLNPSSLIEQKTEDFTSNTQQLMDIACMNAILAVEKNIKPDSKNYKKLIISHLYENGIFELKESISYISDKLDVTKHAIYKHLRQIKKEQEHHYATIIKS